MFSGIKDLDMKIINYLDDRSLKNIFRVNQYGKSLYYNDIFWMNRILYWFDYIGIDILKKCRRHRSWRGYYYNLASVTKEDLLMYVHLGFLDHIIVAIHRGGDIHNKNNHVLAIAAKNGDIEIIQYLISKNVDIHINDDEALKIARHHNKFKVIDLLTNLE